MNNTETATFQPSRRSHVTPFKVMDILGAVADLRAAGHDVISLGAGEPSGGAPTVVSEAAAKVYASGKPLNYTPSNGIEPLRKAISGHYKSWYDLDISPDQIFVTTGSSGAFLVGFLAAFDVGDRVAMARPGYAAYRNVLQALGCEVVEIDAGADHGFQPTPELLQAEVDANGPLAGLVLASPNNPTGTMIGNQSMADITAWCDVNGVRLVSDEIYHGITYDDDLGRGVCSWQHSRTGMVVSSFSKYWGMPGWRLGWVVLPEDLVAPVSALTGSVSLCPPASGQYAAVEAFTDEAYASCDAAVTEFARTRQLILDAQHRLGFTDAAPADGAFYFYAQPPADMLERFGDSVGYAKALLENVYVALTPGVDFDPVNGNRYIRISFAAGYDAVATAIERIEDFHLKVRSQ